MNKHFPAINRSLALTLVALCILLIGADAIAQPASKYHRATIGPSVVSLEPGEQQKFTVVLVATRLMAAQEPAEVRWAVNDIPGGNATYGTITDEGVYTAPAAIPSPREVHICAEVTESANRHLFATVIVGQGRPRYRQLHIWSEPVIGDTGKTEHLTDPHGIGLDRDGNILIADQDGSAVHRYTAAGEYIGRLDAGSGSQPGQVTEPRIVISDVNGDIYATDSKGDRPRVQVWNHEGEFLRIFAEKGMQPGMILRAHGMDFDPQRRLYTIDVDNMRVNVYERTGEFLYDWGREGPNHGEFNAPHGIFVDRSGDVFVTGYYGPTQKFNADGDFVLAFCHGAPPDGPIYFHNVAGDKWGNAYVMVRGRSGYDKGLGTGEETNVSIMKFNNNGDYITAWGFTTEEHYETSAVVDDEGRVYALFKGSKEMGVETFVQE